MYKLFGTDILIVALLSPWPSTRTLNELLSQSLTFVPSDEMYHLLVSTVKFSVRR